MHVISYAHIVDGVLYHATISDLDGRPRATWSYEVRGKKATRDQAIDAATFRALWNGFRDFDVFRRHRVTDMDNQVNPLQNHVISISFGDKQAPKMQYFQVPNAEPDPNFKKWLTTLSVPADGAVEGGVGAADTRELGPMGVKREKVFRRLFGKKYLVDEDRKPKVEAIDVLIFEPQADAEGEDRPFYTLVTSGMSDRQMGVPRKARYQRAELVLYVEEPDETHIEVLRFLAQLPHLQKQTWYGFGSTMTHGQPPRPMWEDSVLDCFFFLEPVVSNDRDLPNRLELEGDEVALLHVELISSAECDFILNHDFDDFFDILEENQHSFLLDPHRKSYVKAKGKR